MAGSDHLPSRLLQVDSVSICEALWSRTGLSERGTVNLVQSCSVGIIWRCLWLLLTLQEGKERGRIKRSTEMCNEMGWPCNKPLVWISYFLAPVKVLRFHLNGVCHFTNVSVRCTGRGKLGPCWPDSAGWWAGGWNWPLLEVWSFSGAETAHTVVYQNHKLCQGAFMCYLCVG